MAEFGEEAKNHIWNAVHTTPAIDVRVFLRPPGGDPDPATGPDALLTTPAILQEFFRRRSLNHRFGESDAGSAHEAYIRSLTPGELADIVWRQLFIDHPPVSEATRIVLTTFGLYGIDVGAGDLRRIREQFAAIPADDRMDHALKLANLNLVLHPLDIMTAGSGAGTVRHPAFRPVLHLDTLLGDWKESAKKLRQQGYGTKAKVDEFTPLELRRFLALAVAESRPAALGLEWPAGQRPQDDGIGRLMRDAVMPVCLETGLPFFLVAGESEAGARVDAPDIADLAPLWEDCPDVRFMLFPTREEQTQPAVMASRRSRNLLLCGFDGQLCGPSVWDMFITRRLEATGSAFHACHSGAQTPEELVGRWAHLRWVLGKALIRHYADLWRTGWRFADADIDRDIRALLGGNARTFLGI